ncbi:MAG TPA: DUF6328 family protein [Candidatus Lumbricidophila sp.]|nr:DUF6328 family protein [Candidatus Lumbricidophila sp.]
MSEPAPAAPDVETIQQRLNRNWADVLQELRVLQTGTQILAGFLLALSFQPAFTELDAAERSFYLGLVVLAALSAIIALAPVALHRSLFRQHMKARMVAYGQFAIVTALITVAVLMVGVVVFVFHLVAGDVAAVAAGSGLAVVIAALWVGVPIWTRSRRS